MTALSILGFVIGVVGYLCLAVKAGLIVSDWTEGTGFSAGFYMMTVCGLVALPVAITVEYFL